MALIPVGRIDFRLQQALRTRQGGKLRRKNLSAHRPPLRRGNGPFRLKHHSIVDALLAEQRLEGLTGTDRIELVEPGIVSNIRELMSSGVAPSTTLFRAILSSTTAMPSAAENSVARPRSSGFSGFQKILGLRSPNRPNRIK